VRVEQILGDAERSLLPADIDRDIHERYKVGDGLE
jgi:hypothetical protein